MKLCCICCSECHCYSLEKQTNANVSVSITSNWQWLDFIDVLSLQRFPKSTTYTSFFFFLAIATSNHTQSMYTEKYEHVCISL